LGGGNGKQPGEGPGGQGAPNKGRDEAPKQPRDRGLLLQPILATADSADEQGKSASFVLQRIQEGNLMGNHLLDALAIGVGVAYGFYAPKATALGNQGMQRLVRKVQRVVRGNNAGPVKEQQVVSIFAMKLENGTERLVAARVGSEGMSILAQQDLPAGMALEGAGNQAQVDFSMKQLVDRLKAVTTTAGRLQLDQLLLDPRLKNQSSLMRDVAKSTSRLESQGLVEQIQSCSKEQRLELQRWLQNPKQPLPKNNPLSALMQQRAERYAKVMPAQQASIATMVELGVAMAVNSAKLS